MQNLKNKTVLITGCAKRIGKAMALTLAESGANLVLHYNTSQDEAKTLSDEVNRLGVKSWTVQADLSDNKQAEGLITRAVDKAAQIDYLINNASIFLPSTLEKLTYDELLQNLQVNAFSPLFISQEFARQKTGTGDTAIINFIDTRLNQLDLQHVAYQLSKEMLHSVTKMMALAFAPSIRVNAIAPGLILPPPGKTKDHIVEQYKLNLLDRAGTKEEISSTVLFLLINTFITGEVITIDGGQQIKGIRYGK